MRVLKAGAHTSLQDGGRFGHQKYGVIVSGAMDTFALKTANILLGNREGEAVLEVTIQGPALEFEEDVWIAICGASLSPSLDGQPISEWRPVYARKGSMLSFGKALNGCRAYIAVAGGFDIEPVLDSKSTYLRAGVGGYCGRVLRVGDVLPLSGPKTDLQRKMYKLAEGLTDKVMATTDWFVSSALFPDYHPEAMVRFVKAPEYHLFRSDSIESFTSSRYRVTPNSDRMGYRLDGEPLALTEPRELISSAVTWGTVQVPVDGKPIVLMADRQTTGGYPRIAQVATVDIPVLAQLKPGDHVRFTEVTIEEAQSLLRQRARAFWVLKYAVQDGWGR